MVLRTITAMLITVVLDRDFDVLPTQVQVCDRIAAFIEHRNLCPRPREAGLDQHDAKPRLFRRLRTGIE